MKCIVVDRPGGHEQLAIRSAPAPSRAAEQVRVNVNAIGVNYADCVVRMGHYEAAKGMYPITPGFEFAGTVDAGAEDGDLRQGQPVFGVGRFGAYATQVSVSRSQVFPIPEGWTFAEAAGVPAVFMTAWYALRRVARVFPGERVLVHSAAGGVGTALAQLATLMGCQVVGVVGTPDKVEVARRCDCREVVVRSKNLWRDLASHGYREFDVIFDSNGVNTVRDGYRRLRRGGRIVVYGAADILPRGLAKPGIVGLAKNYLQVPRFSPFRMTLENRGVLGFNVVFLFDRTDLIAEGMTELLGWIHDQKIKKVPQAHFPFERVADAHRALESGRTVGKLILIVDQSS
jgi:NADPH:quinone reductase-like Zn-dependent oxidoreductase